MNPEARETFAAQAPPQQAEEPRMWERLGLCIALQPLSWDFGIKREWRCAALDIGPVRFTVQWP